VKNAPHLQLFLGVVAVNGATAVAVEGLHVYEQHRCLSPFTACLFLLLLLLLQLLPPPRDGYSAT
jgi:hypothetical protein